jgi:hypothetical protein
MKTRKPLRLLLPGLLVVSALTGCSQSCHIAPLSKPPAPPKEAQEKCLPPAIPLRALTASDVYDVIKKGDEALYACEAKRVELLKAWPR